MQIIQTIIGLGSSVMMPIILFVVALFFRATIAQAFKSGMLVGIGFLGINMVMSLLLDNLGPVTKSLVSRIGLHLTIVDAGWTTGANIGWNSSIMPVCILGFFIINVIMLVLGLTKTVDIDIFNFWTLFLLGALIYAISHNYWISIITVWILFILALLAGDTTAPTLQKQFHLKSISFPQIAYLSWIPFGVLINRIIDKMPVINRIQLSPEKVSKRLGVFGEPVSLGFFLGLFLGLLGGYPISKLLQLSINISACMVILPKMIDLLVDGLTILRINAEKQLSLWFPNRTFYIAMDVSMLLGDPAVLTTGLLMVPVSIVLAFILPGNKLLPLADLSSLMFPFALTAAFMKRNMFRMLIAGPFIVTLALYFSSYAATAYTAAATMSHISISSDISLFSNFIGSAGTWIGAILIFIFNQVQAFL